jgi:hypothetical protein
MELYGYERQDYLLVTGPNLVFVKRFLKLFDSNNSIFPFVLEEDIHLYKDSKIWVRCGGANANIALQLNGLRV